MQLVLPDALATEALGAAIAHAVARQPGAIYLQGDLGAGKTTLARGLLRAAGVTGAIRSPTYTLLEHYQVADFNVLHMDLYRLANPLELENLGLADFSPASSLWLIEWPQQGGALLPVPVLTVSLQAEGAGRRAVIYGNQPLMERLAGQVRERLPQCTKN